MKSKLGDSLVDEETVERGRRILESEAEAILLKSRDLDKNFALLVDRILSCDGHVALSGVGKSGIIGEKIAATLSSTGTPAFFLRPVEALHGDLGTVGPRDLILAISASGETAEVLAVVEAAKELGVEILALTGDPDSTLGREASIALDVGVEREACPLDLAPTSSTTVTLAMGDALAMVLLERRGFTREHFLKFHPGGALGERLRFLVRDLMRSGENLPLVEETASLRQALDEMTARDNVGMTLVTGSGGELTGILTDGDVRRALLQHTGDSHLDAPISKYMGRKPRVVEPDASAAEALRIMEVHGITSLAVVDGRGAPTAVLHLHDILGRAQFRLRCPARRPYNGGLPPRRRSGSPEGFPGGGSPSPIWIYGVWRHGDLETPSSENTEQVENELMHTRIRKSNVKRDKRGFRYRMKTRAGRRIVRNRRRIGRKMPGYKKPR